MLIQPSTGLQWVSELIRDHRKNKKQTKETVTNSVNDTKHTKIYKTKKISKKKKQNKTNSSAVAKDWLLAQQFVGLLRTCETWGELRVNTDILYLHTEGQILVDYLRNLQSLI